jgi:hypothetical protein
MTDLELTRSLCVFEMIVWAEQVTMISFFHGHQYPQIVNKLARLIIIKSATLCLSGAYNSLIGITICI